MNVYSTACRAHDSCSPSPDPRPLVRTRGAGHPLPQGGEGKSTSRAWRKTIICRRIRPERQSLSTKQGAKPSAPSANLSPPLRYGGVNPGSSKLRFARCDLRLRRLLRGKAAPFRCATFHQTCFPPRESFRPPVGGSRERRIHAAENHNISENSAGKAEPFHKAGGEALSTLR